MSCSSAMCAFSRAERADSSLVTAVPAAVLGAPSCSSSERSWSVASATPFRRARTSPLSRSEGDCPVTVGVGPGRVTCTRTEASQAASAAQRPDAHCAAGPWAAVADGGAEVLETAGDDALAVC